MRAAAQAEGKPGVAHPASSCSGGGPGPKGPFDFAGGVRRVKNHPSKQQRLAEDPIKPAASTVASLCEARCALVRRVSFVGEFDVASGVGFAGNLKVLDFGSSTLGPWSR